MIYVLKYKKICLWISEDKAHECKDKDKLCPRLNKDRDCQDTDIQQKCKKLCGLCPGQDI